MHFGVLGPVEVRSRGKLIDLGGPRQAALLAVLLLDSDGPVLVERIIDLLWADRPPRDRSAVQVYVSRLRRTLRGAGADRFGVAVATTPAGYLLRLGSAALDAQRFRELLSEAQARQPGEDAVPLLREALQLWRGPALAGLPDPVRQLAAGLEEARLNALEDLMDLEIQAGRHTDVLDTLHDAVVRYPLRERLRAALMLGLYRAGRKAEALDAFASLAEHLADELGVDPAPAVRDLHVAILRDDPDLDAPPPARGGAGPVRPAQLPTVAAHFTGRDEHLLELDGLLAAGERGAPAIGAIAGTAGVGKTALAIYWGHRVRHRFPDGQLYVNLRGFDPGPTVRPVEALAQFLRALGVPAQEVPVELDEAASRYRSLLADQRMLVVLDNARSPEQVRPLLPGSATSVVLVTSRDRLGGLVAEPGAHRLVLDALTPAEAVALIGRIVGEQRVRAEPAATAALAEMCAYLPLALRIATANLIDRPDRMIADYLAELTERRLSALAIDGDDQLAVRAAFDLSYQGLSEPQRRMFRVLGIAAGPDVTADAAAALAGVTPDRAAELLDQLAGAHLLDGPRTAAARSQPGDRYALHDLLRAYARDLPAPAGEPAAATARLDDWYLHTTHAAATLLYPEKTRLPLPPGDAEVPPPRFDDHTGALAWLDAERANLVATVQDAAEHGPRAVAWLLADALRGYFWLANHSVDWLTTGHAAVAAAAAAGDRRGQAAAERSLAMAHQRLLDYPRAIEHFTAALKVCAEGGLETEQTAVYGSLGSLYWELGDWPSAVENLTKALAINRRDGHLPGVAANLGNLGAVYWEQGRLEEANTHFTAALAVFRELGSPLGEALSASSVGSTTHARGYLGAALDYFHQALAIFGEVGYPHGEAAMLDSIAVVHADAGRYDEALEQAGAALVLARKSGDRRPECGALKTLGVVYARCGDAPRGIEHLEQSLGLAREIGYRYLEAEALTALTGAHRQAGRPDVARRQAGEALELTRRAGFGLLEGCALTALAEVCLDVGDLAGAQEVAQQALAVHGKTGHRLGEARSLRVLATTVARTRGELAARGYAQQAAALFDEIGAAH